MFASHLHFLFPDKDWLICVLNQLPSWCFWYFFFYFPHSFKIFLSIIFSLKDSSALCPITEHLTWWPCISSKSNLSRKHLYHSTFPLVMLLITALFLQLSLISRLSQASLDNVMKSYQWTMLSILTYFTKSNINAR